jgi:hypothetical protein
MNTSTVKIFETDKYRLKIHSNNFLESLIKEDVIIDTKLVLEVKQTIEQYKPGTRFYIFAEGVGFFNMNKEARKLTATKEFSSYMAAVAFFTKNPTLLLLGELYNAINKPAVETRLFTDRDKARRWLKSLIIKK